MREWHIRALYFLVFYVPSFHSVSLRPGVYAFHVASTFRVVYFTFSGEMPANMDLTAFLVVLATSSCLSLDRPRNSTDTGRLARTGTRMEIAGSRICIFKSVVILERWGRALTRCRLNLLEISRQIPGCIRLRVATCVVAEDRDYVCIDCRASEPRNAVPTN